jgi:hypothetical protein
MILKLDFFKDFKIKISLSTKYLQTLFLKYYFFKNSVNIFIHLCTFNTPIVNNLM